MSFKWLQPSKLPKAPSWDIVFIFGVVWNVVVNQSLFGTLFCLGVWVLINLIGAVINRICKPLLSLSEKPHDPI